MAGVSIEPHCAQARIICTRFDQHRNLIVDDNIA
jgi:hypothetical protein